MTDTAGRAREMWLNPPRHDDEHDRVVVEYTQLEAGVIATALGRAAQEAATEGEARLLKEAADDLRAACLTPEQADERLSREATWHPINQLQRILPTVLRKACQWLSPAAVASNAIETAAAIAWSRDGADGKEALLRHVLHTMHRAAETAYPTRRAKS